MGVQSWFTLAAQIKKKKKNEKHSYPVTPQTKTPQKPRLQKSPSPLRDSSQGWWRPSKTQTPSPRRWRVRRCSPWRESDSRSGVDPRRRKTLGLSVSVELTKTSNYIQEPRSSWVYWLSLLPWQVMFWPYSWWPLSSYLEVASQWDTSTNGQYNLQHNVPLQSALKYGE